MYTVIPVEKGDTLAAVRSFLKQLLTSGAMDALLVPLETEQGAILPALVTDPERLNIANPLAPVMPINAARAVSALTGKNPPARLGAFLRPCEIRALIELVKLKQASVEGLIIVSMDCAGTYEVYEFQQARTRLSDIQLRPACRICVHPIPQHADVHLHLFGTDARSGIPLTINDELASQLNIPSADALPSLDSNLTESAFLPVWETAVKDSLARRSQERQKELAAMRASLASNGGMLSLFASCIRCHNCMTVCPICYCKNCLFRTSAMEHAPEEYLAAARRKGALRMLSDTLLFHLTRLNHMSASCVSCGMCTSACPQEIPVGTIFSAIGEQVQATFDYQPGRDLAEPLPLVSYQISEWTEVGEEK